MNQYDTPMNSWLTVRCGCHTMYLLALRRIEAETRKEQGAAPTPPVGTAPQPFFRLDLLPHKTRKG